jgi:hypothetical protein
MALIFRQAHALRPIVAGKEKGELRTGVAP